MGLFKSRKPKWQHKDPTVRLESIESIDPGETDLLAELARQDPDREVRKAAFNRLSDLPVLCQLETNADQGDLPFIVARKDTLLYNQLVNCQDTEEWHDRLVQITSSNLLVKLAVNAGQTAIRLAIVDQIEDQRLLADIVRQNCGKKAAMACMEKINDENLLAELSENGANKTTRRLASDKLVGIYQKKNKQSYQEITTRKLQALADEATQLVNSSDMDAAALRLQAIMQEWKDLDSENTHAAYVSFYRIYADFEDKYTEILERRKVTQEKTVMYEQVRAQQDEICSTIERLTCSTDNDADEIKEKAVTSWTELLSDSKGQIVTSPSIIKRFTDACRAFDTNRKIIDWEKERIKVIGRKCSEAQELIAANNLNKAAVRLKEIKKNIHRIEFKFFNKTLIVKLLSDVSADFEQAKTEVRNENISRRQAICAELKELLQIEKHIHIERQLHTLQQDWQLLTKLEDTEGKKLEQQFQEYVDALNKKLKTLEHEEDWELWANLKLKERLTEQVVALDQEENLETVVNMIKKSQAEWKKTGPVPQEKSQDLWDEFQNACNRNFERAAPYLEELKTRRAEAMERRREICTLAADIARSDDWQKSTLAIKGFQEEWKTLLHGSRREEQRLYRQFREACNLFFERRKEHYRQQDKKRHQNLIDKEKLCEQAEQLAATPQIDHPREFRRLQANWKKVGPVPRKQADAVWKRFRTACDSYFSWLAKEQQHNLQQKEELCELVEKLVNETNQGDNQQEIATRLTELQQQWKEIGPVPRDLSDGVWQRFRKPCDLFFKARKQQHEKEKEQRRIHQVQKEDILARAEDLASKEKDRERTAQLQKLQKEWSEIGPAPHELNKELNDRFKNLCDAYFEERRQYFTDLKAEQLENQKKKESLCLRLENILGLSYKSGATKQDKALSLAEELKQAMEDNFMLAGRRNEKKDISDEIKRIKQDWEQTGPVPTRQIRTLTDRYQKALAAYYTSNKPPKK